jgi:hypothetical protein
LLTVQHALGAVFTSAIDEPGRTLNALVHGLLDALAFTLIATTV